MNGTKYSTEAMDLVREVVEERSAPCDAFLLGLVDVAEVRMLA